MMRLALFPFCRREKKESERLNNLTEVTQQAGKLSQTQDSVSKSQMVKVDNVLISFGVVIAVIVSITSSNYWTLTASSLCEWC